MEKKLSETKTVLTVDEQIAKQLKIKNYFYLFPPLNKQVKWSISLDEHNQINKYITGFADEIVNYLYTAKFLNTDSRIDCYSKLVRPGVAQLLYIILYRTVRIFKFLNNIESNNLLLLNTRNFNAPKTLNNLYSLTRDSWEFNQFIINQLLSDIEIFDHKEKNIMFPDNYWNFSYWSNYTGFDNAIFQKPMNSRVKNFTKST
ncbi:unnamed protein product [marine sediment metagenome]|uniref:Uncharacterized protein n=1 Tax=marine sediment metagenome TaxID=412755 RepID=X1ST09_9ZZZZ